MNKTAPQYLRAGFAARAARHNNASNRITIRPSNPATMHSHVLGRLDFETTQDMVDFLRSRPADNGSAYEIKGQDLRGADLSGLKHLFLIFEDCKLDKANFSGAELWGCVFRNSNLGDADFSNAAWKTGTIENSRAGQANFTNTHFHDVKILGSDVSAKQLNKARDGHYFVDGKLSYDFLGKPHPAGIYNNSSGYRPQFY